MKRLLTCLFLLTACAAAGAGEFIGIVMPDTNLERWMRDGTMLVENAQAKGYRAEVAYADSDQGKQNQDIQNFLTRGAKVVIVCAISEGVTNAVEECAEEGAMVIAYDRLIPNTDKYDYYVTFDNYRLGQKQAEFIVDAIALKNATTANPKYIALFAGSPYDNNAKMFYDGSMSILWPYIENKTLIPVGPYPKDSKDPGFTRVATEHYRADLAKTRMENLLNNDAKNVVLDAVLSPNDMLARAIIEACQTDAKYADIRNIPVVTGQDCEIASLQWINEGKQAMTIFKNFARQTEATIELMDAILKGQKPSLPDAVYDTESYDTGVKKVQSYLLEPIVVTKENMKEILLDPGHFKAAEVGL